mgnify:CR=1 FL=1
MWTLLFLVLLVGIIFLVFYLFMKELNKFLESNKNLPVATVNFYKLRQLIIYFYVKNSFFKEKLGEEVLRGDNEILKKIYISQEKFSKEEYKENLKKLFKSDFEKVREDMRKEEYLDINLINFYYNLPDYIQNMKM